MKNQKNKAKPVVRVRILSDEPIWFTRFDINEKFLSLERNEKIRINPKVLYCQKVENVKPYVKLTFGPGRKIPEGEWYAIAAYVEVLDVYWE